MTTTAKTASTSKANKTQGNTRATTQANTPVADKVTDALHQSVDTLAEHAAGAEDKLRKTATTSAEELSEKQRQAKTYWQQSAVAQYTRENPVATAGIAFAAGVLLTSLLKRK